MGVFVRSGGGVYREGGAHRPTPMRVYLLIAFMAVCVLSLGAVSVTHARAATEIRRSVVSPSLATANRTAEAARNSSI